MRVYLSSCLSANPAGCCPFIKGLYMRGCGLGSFRVTGFSLLVGRMINL